MNKKIMLNSDTPFHVNEIGAHWFHRKAILELNEINFNNTIVQKAIKEGILYELKEVKQIIIKEKKKEDKKKNKKRFF